MIQLGRRIRATRDRLGLTQPALGERLGGVHWTTISRWENDHMQPDMESVAQLAALGGVPVSWFFEQDDSYFNEEE